MDSSKTIDHLPDEILVNIFFYLQFDDLVFSVQYVCSRWRELARDDGLWKTLVYSPLEDEKDSEIAKTLQKIPKLQVLVIDKPVGDAVINTIADNCSKLKKLMCFQELSADSLLKLIHGCQSLEYLTVPSTLLHNVEKTQLIGQFLNLKTIIVINSGNKKDPILLNVLANGCPALQHINLGDQAFNNKDLEYFMNKKQNQLKSLAVQCSGESGKCTIPVLTVCKTLQKLDISRYCNVDIDAGFSSLKSMKNVTSLTLTFNHSDIASNMIHLFDKGAMAHLVELHLVRHGNFVDEHVDVVINNCPLLKVLYLFNFHFMKNVSLQKLQQLDYLERLNLQCCKGVTNEDIVSLRNCKHLKSLQLCGCISLSQQDMKMILDLNNTLKPIKLNTCRVIPEGISLLSMFKFNCARNKNTSQ